MMWISIQTLWYLKDLNNKTALEMADLESSILGNSREWTETPGVSEMSFFWNIRELSVYLILYLAVSFIQTWIDPAFFWLITGQNQALQHLDTVIKSVCNG